MRTTDLFLLLATVAEQENVAPVAFWKNTLPDVLWISPPPRQGLGEEARAET
ncbi:hypothetical protein ACFCYF_16700 [Streptomyces chartreusis]|uniref:hypothetical protein n=1 Tax=Streptomyces chartreusis TaxID=1969 RepID=UPI0035D53E44